MKLRINTVLAPAKPDAPFDAPHRILWLSDRRNEIVLFRIEKPLSVPFFVNLAEVIKSVRDESLSITPYQLPAWIQRPEVEIPERDKNIRKLRWTLIEPLVSGTNRSAIFDQALRGRLILQRVAQTKVHRQRFYPLLIRYWLYGQIPNALLPAFAKCAGVRNIRKPGSHKRGRPTKVLVAGHDLSATGVNVTHDDLQNFYASLREFHLRKGMTISATYDNMIDRYYSSIQERNGEIFHIPFPENQRIKVPAFRYWTKRLLDDSDLQREIMGENLWAKTRRARPGRATDTTIGPTDIFEIDATVDNCYLISSFHRNHLIGRMVVYHVVDRDSTAIVGLHTALEGPSWDTARLALYNAFTDKVAYCKNYGLDISQDEWPFQEMCSLLVADQAEIMGKDACVSLQNMLHIDTEINAVGRPDNKGSVENTHLQVIEPISWVPGAWRARAQEWEQRRSVELKLDACLTLAERTRLLILEVLDYNNNVRVEHLLTKEMIQAGVQPYRRDIGLWARANKIGEGRRQLDIQQLYRCLLPQRAASITNQGLILDGMNYLPEGVDCERLLARARHHRIPIKLHVDSNSTNRAYHFDPQTGTWITWRLSSSSWERYANERLEDVLDLHATQAFDAHDAADIQADRSAVKRQRQRRTVDSAKREKKKAPKPASKAAYFRGVNEHRKWERSLQRGKNARAIRDTEAPIPSATAGNPLDTVINFSSAMARRRAKVIDDRKARNRKKDEQ